MKYELRKKNKGFTLIETLVAVTIVGMALAGPLSIVGKSLYSAAFAKDQITAFYLAQEAIEYIHNLRDTNLIQNTPVSWLKNNDGTSVVLLSQCTQMNPCSVDVPLAKIDFCSPGAGESICETLKYDSTSHLYTNNVNAEKSIFTRYVYLSNVSTNRESSVVVTVSWNTGTLSKSIVLKENLFNK